jgi:hypothetical protein
MVGVTATIMAGITAVAGIIITAGATIIIDERQAAMAAHRHCRATIGSNGTDAAQRRYQ